MLCLHHPARVVGSNWDGRQVEGPILLANLLEDPTVASVPSKPEALGRTQDCPPTPQGLLLVIPASGTPVLQWPQSVRLSAAAGRLLIHQERVPSRSVHKKLAQVQMDRCCLKPMGNGLLESHLCFGCTAGLSISGTMYQAGDGVSNMHTSSAVIHVCCKTQLSFERHCADTSQLKACNPCSKSCLTGTHHVHHVNNLSGLKALYQTGWQWRAPPEQEHKPR